MAPLSCRPPERREREREKEYKCEKRMSVKNEVNETVCFLLYKEERGRMDEDKDLLSILFDFVSAKSHSILNDLKNFLSLSLQFLKEKSLLHKGEE